MLQTQWEMSILTYKWYRHNCYTPEERMLNLNSSWIKDVHVKKLKNKLFEKNQGDYLYNPVLGRAY